MKTQLAKNLQSIREQSPLVHNITNYVVMNNTANALLAIGASPVMAHAIEEVEDMAAIASSLVLNIGTLSKEWVKAMKLAAKVAQERGIPIVLDPVGAGATPYRTATAKSIIKECHPSIIRGNASEIMALVDTTVQTKGVDSVDSSERAINAAKILAKENNTVVVISGETDYITDGSRIAEVNNGNKMMARVTGMGCTATAIVGAMAAINKDAFEAATHGMSLMGIAGEIAAELSKGNGSLQLNFLDTLYNLNAEQIKERIK